MTDSENHNQDSKEKFRLALEKKLAAGKSGKQNSGEKSKVKGSQSGAGGQKMFRRKSGSS